MAGAIGAASPIIRRRQVSVCTTTLGCMHYYVRLCALLYQVVCATMLGCVHYYIMLRALICQVAFVTISGCVCYYIRLCALLYQVACTTQLCMQPQCLRQYIVTSLERLGQVAEALWGRRPRHQASTLGLKLYTIFLRLWLSTKGLTQSQQERNYVPRGDSVKKVNCIPF